MWHVCLLFDRWNWTILGFFFSPRDTLDDDTNSKKMKSGEEEEEEEEVLKLLLKPCDGFGWWCRSVGTGFLPLAVCWCHAQASCGDNQALFRWGTGTFVHWGPQHLSDDRQAHPVGRHHCCGWCRWSFWLNYSFHQVIFFFHTAFDNQEQPIRPADLLCNKSRGLQWDFLSKVAWVKY